MSTKATIMLFCGLLVMGGGLANLIAGSSAKVPNESDQGVEEQKVEDGKKQKAAPKTDKEALQGTWIAQERVAPNEAPRLISLRYTFEGNKFVLRAGKEKHEGSFVLDPGKKPKHIDITIETQDIDLPIKIYTSSDIYELNGDVLVICKQLPARKGREAQGRPNEFKPEQVITFRREGSIGAARFDAKTQEAIDELFDKYKNAVLEVEKQRLENGNLQARAEIAERAAEESTKYIAGLLKSIDAAKNCISVQIARTTFELKDIPIASGAKFLLNDKECDFDDLKAKIPVQVYVESREGQSHAVEIRARTDVKKE